MAANQDYTVLRERYQQRQAERQKVRASHTEALKNAFMQRQAQRGFTNDTSPKTSTFDIDPRMIGFLQRQVRRGNITEEQAMKQLNKPYDDFINRVNGVLSGYDQFVNNYNTRFEGRKYDMTDAYVGDSQQYLDETTAYNNNLLAQTDAILATLEANPEAFDKDTVERIKQSLYQARLNAKSVLKVAENDNAYWSSWGNGEAAKNAENFNADLGATINKILGVENDEYNTAEKRYQKAQKEHGFQQKYGSLSAETLKALADTVEDEDEKAWLNSEVLRRLDIESAEKELEELQYLVDYIEGTGSLRNSAETLDILDKDDLAAAEASRATMTAAFKKYGVENINGLKEVKKEKEQLLEDAKTLQEYVRLSSVKENEDFEKYVKKGLDEANAYNEKNNKTKQMTKSEIKVLAYYIAKDKENGTNLAETYKDAIMHYLKHRRAEEFAEGINDIDIPVIGPVIEGVLRNVHGLTSRAMDWGMDVMQNFTGTKIDPTVYQMAYGYVLNDPSLNWVDRLLYQGAGTVGYMLPSILISKGVGKLTGVASLGKAAGSAALYLGSAGSAYGEALEKGYDKPVARVYSTLVGLSEVTLQNAIGGISEFGGLPAKLEGLIKNFKNALLKGVVKYGISAAGETIEEELQSVLEPVFRSAILGEKFDMPTWQEAIDTALVTLLTTGALEGPGITSKSIKEARLQKLTGDQITQHSFLTSRERVVVNTITQKLVAEAELSGKKLSQKEKQAIYDQVVDDMDTGRIDIKDIEDSIGKGEKYEQLVSEFEELKKLNSMKPMEMTGDQLNRRDELREKNIKVGEKYGHYGYRGYEEAIKRYDAAFSKAVEGLVKSDRLSESYRERDRRSEAYKVEDMSVYSEKQRQTIQAAMDSGILNNTRRTHEFVDLIAKLSEKMGVKFNFTDNKRLKESGFAIDGVTVNGYVNKDGITINVNSAKALNRVVGHEITHILEGTDLYDRLAKAVTAYAKTKGEYESRLKQIRELYKGKEGYTGEDAEAKFQAELVADLVGDYIFTDKAFVEKLFQEEPRLFKRIFEEIKYLCKLATAGSKEARQLEKSKKMFEEVVREASKKGVKNPTAEGGVKYSITEPFVDQNGNKFDSAVLLDSDFFDGLSPRNWAGKLRKFVKMRSATDPFIMPVVDENGNIQQLQFAKVSDRAYKPGKAEHNVLNELASGTDNISKLAVIHIDEIADVSDPNSPYYTPDNEHQWLDQNGWLHRTAYVINAKNGKIYKLVFDIAKADDGRHILYATKGKINKVGSANVNSLVIRGSKLNSNFINNVAQSDPTVKRKDFEYQFAVEHGDLKAAQKLVDQAARDAGYTVKAYHGTDAEAFNEFDKGRIGDATGVSILGDGFYFADNKKTAQQYGKNVYTVYIKQTKPYYATADDSYRLTAVQLEKQGHDSVVLPTGKGNIYMVLDSNQIKSAEAVTYDDDGNVIPLSKRFNSDSNDIRYSLSSQEKADAEGQLPLPWQVRGQDVALEQEGLGLPMRSGYQESQVAVAESQQAQPVNLPGLEKSQPQSQGVTQEAGLPMPKQSQQPQSRGNAQADEVLPMPGDTVRAEQQSLDDEYRRQAGINEDPSLYDPDEEEGVETVRDKLEVKQKNLQWELQENQRGKETALKAKDQLITELQAKYDAKKHKESKSSQALLRRIQRETRLKSDIAAEYDQKIARIQSRIGNLEEKLQTSKPEKQDRLEQAYQRIDAQLDYDERELAKEYYAKRGELQKDLGTKDQNTWVGDKARDLLWEMAIWEKGKRPSKLLGALWDTKYDWTALKHALADIRDGYAIVPSPAEPAVRDVLNRAYADRVQEMKDLDARYEEDLELLRKEAQEQKDKAKLAESRRGKQQQYTAEVAELVGDTTTWKDKKLGISYQTNTLRRNLRYVVRDAFGKQNIQKADAIYDYLQGSYNRNEAELNRESARIKNPYSELKITKAEDAYIQMLGELRHNPDTELLPEQVEEFYQAHKDKIDKAKVDKVIDMARETYDSLLIRLNEVLQAQGMKEIPYRKGYFPHFTEDKQGWFAKILNWKVNKNQLPTDIAGLTESYQPQRSWQRFNKQRMSDTTDYSFMKGMDNYVQGALDWIYHIEDIQRRRAFENYLRYIHSDKGVQKRIDEVFASNAYDATEAQEQIDLILKEKANPLNNFVTDLRTGTNLLAGKKHSKDRNMEMDLNREVYSTMTNISSRVSANMVAGSISSAMTNFIPITQSWAQVSPLSSLKAMVKTIQAIRADDGVVDKSDFLTNRLRQAEKLYQSGWDKASRAVGWLMESVDNFTSQVVWRSKYMENMEAGMTELDAIRDADQFAENVMAGRSRGNMPTIFESKNLLTRMATAFQLEVANQYGYMFKDMPQEMKDAGIGKMVKGYATMFLGAYVYNALFSMLTGRNSAFDPIRILQGFIGGLVGDDDEEKKPMDAFMQLAEDVLQEVPFVGGFLGGGRVPISSALPYDGNVMDILSGVGKLAEGDFSEFTSEWLNPVYYLVLPMGGGQIKKTNEAIAMYKDGVKMQLRDTPGSYTSDGKLRFPAGEDAWSVIRNLIFGKWSSQNAQQYIEEGRSPLSEKQTQEFKDTGMDIRQYWDYLDGLKQLNKESNSGTASINDVGDYIGGLDLTTEQKNILINNAAGRKEPIDMATYDEYPNFEEFDYGTQNPGKYAVSQAVGGFKDFKKYQKDLNGLDKDETADYINDLDIDYGMKIILYVFKCSNKASREAYGYDIVEYLNGRSDISVEQIRKILRELGFKVDWEGNVTWD